MPLTTMPHALQNETWMEGSKRAYRDVILFIYCCLRELTGVNSVEHELGINYFTTVVYNNYLQNPPIIAGTNTTVEVDESLFSRRKNHQVRVLPQQLVFGGWCRETRESFMYTVPGRRAATLLPIIQGSIRPGMTTAMSDLWRAHGGVAALGYKHITVDHSMNFVDPQTAEHTQSVERSWKLAKERNKRRNGTHRQMLDSYLWQILQLTGHQVEFI